MSKMITVDGNEACAKIAYYMSELATVYPITPSSPMAETCEVMRAKGVKNFLGSTLDISELQSEGGASGAMHGSLSAGTLTTTFTASQGLLLMIPNMYKIAGEMLPCVMHVTARTIATHALSIFGDHSDIYAVRQTGFAMLASSNVQECMDLAVVAHLATLESGLPFVHFFDGFRTSHEIQKIHNIEYCDLDKIINLDSVQHFRDKALSPNNPTAKGTTQNPDCYFQNLEARNIFYDKLPAIVSECMDKLYSITGRKYNLADYFGSKKPTKIVVIMCSGGETVLETIDYLNNIGENVGLIKIRLYRPFPHKEFISIIPDSCKYITVLDRTKEFSGVGEPLYQDVISSLQLAGKSDIKVFGGRYGISSKEFTPSMVKAVYDNMSESGKNFFTVGIDDDVTNSSLTISDYIDTTPKDCISCKFYGLGSDGTVGANKNSIKIIGDNTDKFAQAYFAYDSKKSGGLTTSHLRFGDSPIKSCYLIEKADFVACHNSSFLGVYDMVQSLKKGGKFLLNTSFDKEKLSEALPCEIKQFLAQNKIDFYIIDANKLAKELGLGGRINTIMQACFFKLSSIIEYENAYKYMVDYTTKTFALKGEKVVQMNVDAITKATDFLEKVNIPSEWEDINCENKVVSSGNAYFDAFSVPVLKGKGDSLKVSAFSPDGKVPTATTQFEKRGISDKVSSWIKENCIQCNQCAFVCPHACIRPILLEDKQNIPDSFETIDAIQPKGQYFRLQISPRDCTGCGSCINTCPAPKKALEYKPLESEKVLQKDNWEFAKNHENSKEVINKKQVKGVGFARQLFEFSGACSGCGETPYVKLATSLFGDKMIIANATGCSSIYGGSAPTCPFAKTNDGKGPAWANSLFEDNAEFGYGISLGANLRRKKLKKIAKKLIENRYENEYLTNWLNTFDDKKLTEEHSKILYDNIQKMADECCSEENKSLLLQMAKDKDAITKKSIWIIGGDGWAYDIGYGGLDHILASGEDVNILVLDSEVYSNTGGQASKATQIGAVAKFAQEGKKTAKKDLGLMAINYDNVYVASVAMGADMNQCLKAFNEAEEYNGVSLIIAYSPCINHGINMSNCMLEEKLAVECGYWNLFRFAPNAQNNKFMLDSKAPKSDYVEFLKSENRFASLKRTNPENFERLLEKNKEYAIYRYNKYLQLAEMYKNL